MDGSGRVTFVWGDGEHTFRLAYKQLRELQDKTGCGPEELAQRIASGKWRVDDLREVLRLGLIGGGMEPTSALTLVIRYFDGRPLLESKQPAYLILLAILAQPEGDKVGKAGRRGAAMKKAAESLSPNSSELPSQSASPSKSSGTVRRGNSPQPSKATTATTAETTNPRQ